MFKFSKREVNELLFTIFIISFVLSFDQWGIESFDFTFGLRNLILTFVLVAICLLVKLYVQKYFSNKVGFNTSFRSWPIGLFFGLLLIFVTNGNLIFLIPGTIVFTMLEKTRIGQEEYNLSYNLMGWISVIGPLTSILLAFLGKLAFGEVNTFVSINLWLAVFAVLPIPYIHKAKIGGEKKIDASEGLNLFYAAPLQYFIFLILAIFSMLSVLFLSTAVSFVILLICYLLIFADYFFLYQQNIKRKSHRIFRYGSH